MKFILKTNIVLEKEFFIEADTPKEAMDLVQEQIYESEDFNSLEITHIGFDMDHGSPGRFFDPLMDHRDGSLIR